MLQIDEDGIIATRLCDVDNLYASEDLDSQSLPMRSEAAISTDEIDRVLPR